MKYLLAFAALLLLAVSPSLAAANNVTAPTAVGVVTGDVQGLAADSTHDTRLCGFSLTETTGSAAAEVILRVGTTSGGTALYDVTLTSGESTSDRWPCADGEKVSGGVYVDWISGSVRVTLFTRRF